MLENLKRWAPVGKVPEIEASELHRRLNEPGSIVLVDVRTRSEWRRSRIPGALSLPITRIRSGLATLSVEPSVQVVAICLSAHRSIPAVRLLRNHGYRNAVQLAGGMRAWWAQSLPVEGTRHVD